MANSIKLNRIIKTLLVSDLLYLTSIGFMAPIFAIFVTDQIRGGSIEIVGIAMGFHWLAIALLEIPFARFFDKHVGEHDDFIGMLAGAVLVSIASMLYAFASDAWHVYALQGLTGVGVALNHPTWTAIFNRHVDRDQIAFDWGVAGVIYAVSMAITSGASGFLVEAFGFKIFFVIVGAVSLLGALILLFIRQQLRVSVMTRVS